MGRLLRATSRFLYQRLAKPLFFRRDPETVHDAVISLGTMIGSTRVGRTLTRSAFAAHDERLTQTIHGVFFPNPVGLAAGFDKNAALPDILGPIGFGWAELGSVTGKPCAGNPQPRLWRIPEQQSLRVWYGLKNDGAEAVARRLAGRSFPIPIGISVAKTNAPETCETSSGIADYASAFHAASPVAAHLTVNISCPNAFGGEPFTSPERLELLLTELDRIPVSAPVFLKLPANISFTELDALVAVAAQHRVHGLISTNLKKEPGMLGGLSGGAVRDLADAQLAHLGRTARNRFTLVGCGGIFSAEDAYRKIRLGASLVQLITGMIYEGPQLIGEINAGLLALLKRDGFTQIQQAIGLNVAHAS